MNKELEFADLTVRYGALVALSHVSMRLQQGEVVALIGPNGAGKTTLLNTISGLQIATAGKVNFGGADISREPAYKRTRLGIGRTFQHARLMGNLDVLENVLVGGYSLAESPSMVAEWLRLPNARAALWRRHQEALDLLESLDIAESAALQADRLSFGQKKLVDLARALMTKPEVILMDEPTAGLSETEIKRLAAVIKRIRRSMAVFVVAHHMGFVADVANRVICLAGGKIIADGSPKDVRENPWVLAAYLGN